MEKIYVAIGGTGENILKSYSHIFRENECLLLDTCPAIFSGIESVRWIKFETYHKEKLSVLFDKDKEYVIFTGLGGNAGSSIVVELLSYLAGNDISYQCYAFYPYYFEGKTRLTIADEIMERLLDHKNVTVINMDEVKKGYPHLYLADAFAIPNEFFVEKYVLTHGMRQSGVNGGKDRGRING